MARSFKTILACVLLVSCLAIGFGAGPVQADTTFLLSATSNHRDLVGDFSLRYVDRSIPGAICTIDEVVWFSGLTPVGYYDGIPLNRLLAVPGPNDTDSPFTTKPPVDIGQFAWTFGRTNDSGSFPIPSSLWSYTQTPVPLPPSVFLLGAGLIGLAGWRRLKKGKP